MQESKYRADIDGLRAIAVISVIFYHIGLSFPGGYVGVDVFFVISGFLITRLIVKDLKNDTFSLAQFWERRIRRIFPVLAFIVLVVLSAAYFILLPLDFKECAESAISQSVMSSNFYFWQQSGYFETPAETKPLLHTWSLAVEEQFYLIFLYIRKQLQTTTKHAKKFKNELRHPCPRSLTITSIKHIITKTI